jgi:hypothetical protein
MSPIPTMIEQSLLDTDDFNAVRVRVIELPADGVRGGLAIDLASDPEIR